MAELRKPLKAFALVGSQFGTQGRRQIGMVLFSLAQFLLALFPGPVGVHHRGFKQFFQSNRSQRA